MDGTDQETVTACWTVSLDCPCDGYVFFLRRSTVPKAGRLLGDNSQLLVTLLVTLTDLPSVTQSPLFRLQPNIYPYRVKRNIFSVRIDLHSSRRSVFTH